MSIIYSVVIVMLAVVMFAVMLQAVISVSHKPSWVVEAENEVRLTVIDGIDRREMSLPFVGVDRRKTSVEAPAIKKAA